MIYVEKHSVPESLKKYIFSSPVFPEDDNKTHLYSVLNLIILNYWLIFIIAIVIVIVSVHKEAAFFILLLLGLVLLFAEYIKWINFYLTSHVLFGGIWSLISIIYLLTWIPLNNFSLWYIPFIIGVSLLLGKKWSYFYTLITLILILSHLILNNSGYVIEPYFVVQWYTGFIVFFIGFIQTIPPINLMITGLRESEDKYKNLSSQLEEKVVERTNQLEDANKELELYAYSLSHDLRNPLESIIGLANLITNDYSDELPEPVNVMINKIENTSNRINKLAKELLQYFTLKNEKLHKEIVDMNKLIGEILENYSEEIMDRNVKVEVEKLPSLDCDILLITQVWINLISNAFKYTKLSTDPYIKIGYYSENEKNIYYIKDNGIGFDMEKAQHIFQPFYRLHKNQEFEGTGIGLAFVESIISKHEGKIWFSAQEQKGATFYFTI